MPTPPAPQEVPEAELRPLYPHIEPYRTGMLDVGDGHRLYWEECGNPDGKPAVFVHGGPGGGCGANARRFFDPARYRIVLIDQRSCGRSLPHASEPACDLSTNTTWDLVADLERLRADRGIEKWLVFGGSWGSALSLAYAEKHPEAVSELVLRGIFTLRRSELDWYYNGGAGNVAPAWRERFLEPLGGSSFDGDAIAAYHELLSNPDPDVHGPAGVAWTTWEGATCTLRYSPEIVESYSDPAFAIAFARIENHYFVNGGWFREGQLIADVDAIRAIPAVIVQGCYDLACPAVTAHDLHRAWPEAEYRLMFAGHSAFEPQITHALIEATDAFAG
nr:prolyl aminopeptidase [Nigerium massiliense]